MAEEEAPATGRESRSALVGFGSLQATFYAIVIIGLGFGQPVSDNQTSIVDLILVLAALFCTLAVLAGIGRRRNLRPDSQTASWFSGITLVLSFGFSQLILLGDAGGFGPVVLILRVVAGCSIAVLLYLWGRVLGSFPIGASVPVAFIGSALAASVIFLVMAIPWPQVTFVVVLLPLLSAFTLTRLTKPGDEDRPSVEVQRLVAQPLDTETGATERGMRVSLASARRLDGRIYGGTLIYGFAIGLVVATMSASSTASMNVELMLLLFVLFALAALQLFRGTGSPLSAMRSTRLLSAHVERGPLDGAYRLAVLLMLIGFLLMPLAGLIGTTTVTVVIAGYLAVLVVFMALFLIMGSISGTDAGLYFSRGLLGFFGGELIGILIVCAIAFAVTLPIESVIVVIAAIAVLIDYLFVFTDRDLTELSLVVDDVDRFESVCLQLGERFKLSPRESEVASLALRGRSSERIGQELSITKNTVDTHLRRIYRKCGVHGRQELIDLVDAMESGS